MINGPVEPFPPRPLPKQITMRLQSDQRRQGPSLQYTISVSLRASPARTAPCTPAAGYFPRSPCTSCPARRRPGDSRGAAIRRRSGRRRRFRSVRRESSVMVRPFSAGAFSIGRGRFKVTSNFCDSLQKEASWTKVAFRKPRASIRPPPCALFPPGLASCLPRPSYLLQRFQGRGRQRAGTRNEQASKRLCADSVTVAHAGGGRQHNTKNKTHNIEKGHKEGIR